MLSIGRRYARLFRAPDFGYLMITSLLARVPEGMLSLAITLLVTRNGSYARAGVVVAMYVTGAAVAGPGLGRLVDRLGRAVILVPASLAEAASLVAMALMPAGWTAGVIGSALAAGLCTPPVVAAARSLWPEVLPGDEATIAYALEATLQELIYIVGPSLIALAVTLAGPSVAMLVVAALLTSGVLTFSLHPRVRRRPAPRPADRSRQSWRPPLSLPPLLCALLLTGAFSFVELSTVRLARSQDAPALAGVALAVWSAGSLLGGLFLGTRLTVIRDPRRRLVVLMFAAGVLMLPPAAAPAMWVLVPLLFVSGIAIAPTVAALYSQVAAEVRGDRGTEAFGWLSGGFQVGTAMGALAGGLVVQTAGARVGFLASAGVIGVGLPGLAVAALRRRPASGTEEPFTTE